MFKTNILLSPIYFSIICCLGGVSYGFFLGNFFQPLNYPNEWNFQITQEKKVNNIVLNLLQTSGSFIGTMLAGFFSFRIGRVKTTLLADFLTLIAIILYVSSNIFEFAILGRFLMGISSGMNFPLMLILINEFVILDYYLLCLIFFQTSNTIGIFISNLLCLSNIWWLAIAIAAIFPIVRFIYFFFFFLSKNIESPIYILNSEDYTIIERKERCMNVFKELYPEINYQNLYEWINKKDTLLQDKFFLGHMFRKKYFYKALFCTLVLFLNQSSGIDEVLGYSGLYFSNNSFLLRYQPLIFSFVNMLGGLSLLFTVPKSFSCNSLFPKGFKKFAVGTFILIIILAIFSFTLNYSDPQTKDIVLFNALGSIYLLIFQQSLGLYPFIYILCLLPDIGVFMVLIIRSCFQMTCLLTFYFSDYHTMHIGFVFCFYSSIFCLIFSGVIFKFFLPKKYKEIIGNDDFKNYPQKIMINLDLESEKLRFSQEEQKILKIF